MKLINASDAADKISEKLNIPLSDLVDVMAEIPEIEIRIPKVLRLEFEEAIVPGQQTSRDGDPVIRTETITYPVCPNCDYDFCEEEKSYFDDGELIYIPKYCPNCGQALVQKGGLY